MKKLRFIYNMSLKFDSDVRNHYFSLKCIPQNSSVQKIYSIEYEIEPSEKINNTTDGFGNAIYIGHCLQPHNHFGFNICGIAWIDNSKAKKEVLNRIFLYESKYIKFSSRMRGLFRRINVNNKNSNLKNAMIIMEYLYKSINYIKGITDINTTTEDVLKLKCGVCQDYSHLMIGLCRLSGIPARYVAGLMIGEGETHAWVEIYNDGIWKGLDPTNNKVVDDYYIKLSHGRDYGDCVIDKGSFLGITNQEQKVYVLVEEI